MNPYNVVSIFFTATEKGPSLAREAEAPVTVAPASLVCPRCRACIACRGRVASLALRASTAPRSVGQARSARRDLWIWFWLDVYAMRLAVVCIACWTVCVHQRTALRPSYELRSALLGRQLALGYAIAHAGN